MCPTVHKEAVEGVSGVLVAIMRSQSYVTKIEYIETLLAELKAIAFWNRAYWECRHRGLSETVALVSRYRRRIEILSELVTIMAAMSGQKSDAKERILQNRKRVKRSFLRGDT
jgi:hypothetical protein